jgi:aspartate/methionine/tyrosine aminotransferase
LAIIALKAREQILARNRELIASNLQVLSEFFNEYSDIFEWHVPEGGCVGFPRYRGSGNVDGFCEQLVEEEGVLLLPASVYRSDLMDAPSDRFRIGFGRANIDDGLQAFRGFLERHRSDLAA